MNRNQNWMFAALGFGLALGAACSSSGSGDEKAAAEKKAFETAAEALKGPIGLISAYRPHLAQPDTKQKYYVRKNDVDRALFAAANEIRHAANSARQNVERAGGEGTKDVVAALTAVTVACTEAQEAEQLAKCDASVASLDAALAKAETARTAAGATAKIPRISAEWITEDAKKGIAPFLKAKGPSAAEEAFLAKRGDPAAAGADVITACQTAASDAEIVQKQMERADEPIRLVAVTHKMALDSQCNRMSTAEGLRKDVGDCKKKAKSPECKIICGKAKQMIDEGVPAAAFEPLTKDYASICEK